MNLTQSELRTRTAQLRQECGSAIAIAGDPAYEILRMPWNAAIEQRPAAVSAPASSLEVATVVAAASRLGLRVAAQSTGHAAGALAQHDLNDVVLLRTHKLDEVRVDPQTRTARVGGGAVWKAVVEAAAPHGLAALHGSSPDVGVAGYLLGGGLSWYARRFGLAANDVLDVEMVTPDGQVITADAVSHPELFWALRGGGGNFGVVTAMRIRLHEIADAYAGMLLWDISEFERVLRHWVRWCSTAPDSVTTALRAMRFPPMPELPPFLSGRSVVVLDGAVLDDDRRGEELLAGFRALHPEVDTFARIPVTGVSTIHMDPEDPTPSVGGGTLLGDLDEEGILAIVRALGPESPTSLFIAELRQLGGAIAKPNPSGGAVNRLDADFAAVFVGMAFTPEMAQAAQEQVTAILAELANWESGQYFLNLVDKPVDPRQAYDSDTWTRLREIRSQIDPGNVMLANHIVPVGRD